MMLKRWTRSVALLLAVLFCLSCCSKAEKMDYDTNPLSFETVFDDTLGNPDKPDTADLDYDTNPLSFETVFDDTLGNPDKPDTADSELCRYEPPAYRIRIYHFRENTIAKGAFYLLPPEYGHPLEDTPPEEGIIKGVFTFDYTKEGDDICIHSFTLSYETAEGITIRGHPLEDTPPEEGIIKGVFTFDYTKEGDDICIHSFTLSYETAEGITIRNPEVYAVDLVRTPVVDNQISLKHLRILSRKPSSNIFFSGSFDYKGEEHSFQIDL